MSTHAGAGELLVVAAGPLTTIQDLGRPGLAHLGVPRGGAADRASLGLANRLVGNAPGAACLEVTLGGLSLRAGAAATLAVTGAAGELRVAGRAVAPASVLRAPAGAPVDVGPATAGLRWYVAVRGGIDVPAELGSRATDTLSGLGPPPVADGDVLPVGTATAGWPLVDAAPVAVPPAGLVVLRLVPGPRDARLAAGELGRLLAATWRVAAASDRVGLRFEGPPLRLSGGDERPSEGVVRGGIQVPPGGGPVMFLADHPVTGGYPVVACVPQADVDRAAQLRPGQEVRFRPTTN